MDQSDGENDMVKPGCCFPLGCGDWSMRRRRRRNICFRRSKKPEKAPWLSNSFSQKLPKSASSDSPRRVVTEKNPELVVCFGQMLVDFITSISGISLAQTPAFKKAAGGAAASVAVGIARLGGSSAFIGKVGEDEFGHMLANILKQNNVDDAGLRFDPNAKTTLSFVNLTANGEHETMFFSNPGADMILSETEIDRNLIKKSGIFHYGSTSLIKEPCKSALLAAMEIAKQSGSILSYAPNLRLPLWSTKDDARQGIMSIWNQADIIKVSNEEVTFLAGDDMLEKLYHPNLKLLIVTDGANGCSYYTKEFKGKVPTLIVDPLDTTGAGDAFLAGLLSCLAKDPILYEDEAKLREVLFFGNRCGALSVMQKGAIPALPTREQVLRFLKTI